MGNILGILFVVIVLGFIVYGVVKRFSKSDTIIPPPPPTPQPTPGPIYPPEPTYYHFDCMFIEVTNSFSPCNGGDKKVHVISVNQDFCLSDEFVNFDDIFEQYPSGTKLALFFNEKYIITETIGTRTVIKKSDCTLMCD
jgi:hypothetical protein